MPGTVLLNSDACPHLVLQEPQEAYANIIPDVQVRKLRLRETQSLSRVPRCWPVGLQTPHALCPTRFEGEICSPELQVGLDKLFNVPSASSSWLKVTRWIPLFLLPHSCGS